MAHPTALSEPETPPLRALQSITIQDLDADPSPRYSSVIVDYTEGVEMEIGVPLHGGREIMLRPGARIALEVQAGDAVIRYTSVVRERKATAVPSLLVDWPEGGRRYQRREDFRVQVRLRVELGSTIGVDGREPLIAESADLSLGGIRLISLEALVPGQVVDLRVCWPDRSPLAVQGKVIRGGEIDGGPGATRYWTAVQFTRIAPTDRRDLTKFLFDRQREMLRS